MSPSLQLAMALLLGGLFVLALEMFIPSMGMLFLIGAACILSSVIVAFNVSATAGWVFVGIVLFLAVVLPRVFFEVWKRSWIGRRMLLDSPNASMASGSVERPGDPSEGSGAPDLSSLRGEVGKTLTPLRPAGTSQISGRRVDTVAQGVMIDRGEWVRVIDVQGNRVVVTRVSAEDVGLPAPPTE